MARTRKQRIASLEARHDWLVGKEAEYIAAGRESSYLREEREALEWALPILRALVEADRRRRAGEDPPGMERAEFGAPLVGSTKRGAR